MNLSSSNLFNNFPNCMLKKTRLVFFKTYGLDFNHLVSGNFSIPFSINVINMCISHNRFRPYCQSLMN